MIERELTVQTVDGPMALAVRHPDGDGPYPVVVAFHDGPGLRTDIFRLLAARPGEFVAGSTMHPSFCVTDDEDSPHTTINTLSAELFVAFGSADTLASLEHNKPLHDELSRPTVNAAVEIVDGADHGFMFPGLPAYHERGATVCWQHTLDLFGRTLA